MQGYHLGKLVLMTGLLATLGSTASADYDGGGFGTGGDNGGYNSCPNNQHRTLYYDCSMGTTKIVVKTDMTIVVGTIEYPTRKVKSGFFGQDYRTMDDSMTLKLRLYDVHIKNKDGNRIARCTSTDGSACNINYSGSNSSGQIFP